MMIYCASNLTGTLKEHRALNVVFLRSGGSLAQWTFLIGNTILVRKRKPKECVRVRLKPVNKLSSFFFWNWNDATTNVSEWDCKCYFHSFSDLYDESS